MVEMVRLVPSRVTDAERVLLVTGWSCHVHGGAVIEGFVGIIPLQIREKAADVKAGNGAGVAVLDGRGRIDKVKRNANVNSEVPREVVPKSGAKIVDAAIAAVASLELGPQRYSRSEASRVIFCRAACGGGGGVSQVNGTKTPNEERAQESAAEKPPAAATHHFSLYLLFVRSLSPPL